MGRGKFGAGSSSMEATLIPEAAAKKGSCSARHSTNHTRDGEKGKALPTDAEGINSLSGSSGASFGVGSSPPSGFVSIPGSHEVPLRGIYMKGGERRGTGRHSPREEVEGGGNRCSGTIWANFSGRSPDLCWECGIRLLEPL